LQAAAARRSAAGSRAAAGSTFFGGRIVGSTRPRSRAHRAPWRTRSSVPLGHRRRQLCSLARRETKPVDVSFLRTEYWSTSCTFAPPPRFPRRDIACRIYQEYPAPGAPYRAVRGNSTERPGGFDAARVGRNRSRTFTRQSQAGRSAGAGGPERETFRGRSCPISRRFQQRSPGILSGNPLQAGLFFRWADRHPEGGGTMLKEHRARDLSFPRRGGERGPLALSIPARRHLPGARLSALLTRIEHNEVYLVAVEVAIAAALILSSTTCAETGRTAASPGPPRRRAVLMSPGRALIARWSAGRLKREQGRAREVMIIGRDRVPDLRGPSGGPPRAGQELPRSADHAARPEGRGRAGAGAEPPRPRRDPERFREQIRAEHRVPQGAAPAPERRCG